MKSLLSFPLQSENGENFVFRFYGRREDTYNSEHLVLLQRLQPTLAKIIEVKSRLAKGVMTQPMLATIPVRLDLKVSLVPIICC